MRANIFSAFVLAVLLVGTPLSALAAEAEGIELSPAVFQEKADPGGTYTFRVNVRNVSETEKTLYVTARDIKGINESGTPEFASEGEPTPYNLSTWISLPETEVVVPPGGQTSVPFTVTVPKDATPGGHFGGIFLESKAPRLRQTGAGVGFNVGSLINLQISGDIVEEARVREFSTGQLLYDKLPVAFDIRLENKGNTLVRPSGFVEVIDMFGKEVASISVNENAGGTFPQSERTYNVVWKESDFAFGRYQALATLVYGDEVRKTLTATAAFWVLPIVPIASVLGGVLAFILILYFGIRMHIQKRLREMGVSSSSRSQAALYAQKHQQPLSKTLLMVVGVIFFCALFLVGLFVMFA